MWAPSVNLSTLSHDSTESNRRVRGQMSLTVTRLVIASQSDCNTKRDAITAREAGIFNATKGKLHPLAIDVLLRHVVQYDVYDATSV